jgi:hypothetical protein
VGSLAIAGLAFTVTQTGCSFAISPTATTYGSTGGASSVAVTAPAACPWTVTNVPPWASTSSGGSGTGSGTWQYSVTANGGGARSQAVSVAGNSFVLSELAVPVKTMTAGTRSAFTLANASDARWSELEMVIGRSYCGQVSPAATAVDAANPTLTVYRADGTTVIGSGSSRVCFIATTTESALLKLTQTDASARTYELAATETTLWADWFYTGASFSSLTLLRNTTDAVVHAALIWRDPNGAVVGLVYPAVPIPPRGQTTYDAHSSAPGAIVGSVEIVHDGEPQALVGSQITFDVTTGLKVDAPLGSRAGW